jgi:hypothetical protein
MWSAARRLLLRLLALAIGLQAGLAPAHCLARAAADPAPLHRLLGAAICTPDGLRAAPPDAPGEQGHQGDLPCAACAALPQALLPDPPALAGPAWAALGNLAPATAGPPAPPAAGPPYRPTGPPAA